MSENEERKILARRLVEFQKNTTRYLGPKICASTESLCLPALNAMDREAFGSELAGRKMTHMRLLVSRWAYLTYRRS
jgi:hypothetical protein